MHYQLLAFALLTCVFPALVWAPSAFTQETDAPAAQKATSEAERSESGNEREGRSERRQRRGALALTGNEAAAEWILPTHRSIIELAEMAQENAKSAEVRSFAETLHAEHTELINQLHASLKEEANRRRQAREERRGRRTEIRVERRERRSDSEPGEDVAEVEVEVETDDNREVLDRFGERAEKIISRAEEALGDVVDDAATRASRRLRAAVRGFPWIQIQQETAKNALAMAKEDLEARQAFEFDQVYLGYASAQHVQAIAELKAVEPEVSAETKELIETTLPKMQRHRQMASQLMREISTNAR